MDKNEVRKQLNRVADLWDSEQLIIETRIPAVMFPGEYVYYMVRNNHASAGEMQWQISSNEGATNDFPYIGDVISFISEFEDLDLITEIYNDSI